MAGFFAILGSIVLGNLLWWRWADRRVRDVPPSGLWRLLVGAFVLTQLIYLAAFLLVPSWTRSSHHVLPADVIGIFYLWSIVVLPATVLASAFIALGQRIGRLFGKVTTPVEVVESTESVQPSLSRRQLLGAAAVAVSPLAATGGVVFGRQSLYDLEIKRLDLPIANLPRDLDGLTIAHLTDIHVGKFVSRPYLKQVADLTNRLNADIHLLTGDLIDLSILDLPDALDFVSSLEPRWQRPVMCEGNHDLIESPDEFYRQTRLRGIDVVRESELVLRVPGRRPLQILGRRWGGNTTPATTDTYFEPAVEQLRRRVDELREKTEAFPILLAHHPHAFDAAAAAGIPLTLAGHTHGGLLMLSERTGPATYMYRYFRGLYNRDNASLYVSNGVGSWFPVRTYARPEVALLTLKAV